MPNLFRVSIEETGFQSWTNFPNSPPNSYPYQAIGRNGTNYYLFCCTQELGGSVFQPGYTSVSRADPIGGLVAQYKLTNGAWVYFGNYMSMTINDPVLEANTNLYTNSRLEDIYFGKTTTADQDAGIVKTLVPIT